MITKTPRRRERDYLGYVAAMPCAGCLARTGRFVRPVQVAHLRSGSLEHGKRPTGGAEKPGDRWTSPLCWKCHESQHHRGDELAWWAELGIDPFALCVALQADFDRGLSGLAPLIAHAAAARAARLGVCQ